MTKAKQKYKNPNIIEKVYIQLRFPNSSQLNKIKRGRKSNIVKVVWKSQNMNNAKPIVQKISFVQESDLSNLLQFFIIDGFFF